MFSHFQLFMTLWTAVYQAPLSMGFSRQEYWSGLSCPSPGDLSDPGIKPMSPASPVLQAYSLTTEPPGKPIKSYWRSSIIKSIRGFWDQNVWQLWASAEQFILEGSYYTFMILNFDWISSGFSLQMRFRNTKSSYKNTLPGNHLEFPVQYSLASELPGDNNTCSGKKNLSYRFATAMRSKWFAGKAVLASSSY